MLITREQDIGDDAAGQVERDEPCIRARVGGVVQLTTGFVEEEREFLSVRAVDRGDELWGERGERRQPVEVRRVG